MDDPFIIPTVEVSIRGLKKWGYKSDMVDVTMSASKGVPLDEILEECYRILKRDLERNRPMFKGVIEDSEDGK
jgi:hypothetical protein